jgi:hypothetical protein
MAGRPNREGEADTATVLKEALQDVEKVVRQQVDLLRVELGHELGKARSAAVSLGAGAACLVGGGALVTVALVHALRRATGLPLWSCYGLVSGLVGAAGVGLIKSGLRKAGEVQLVPPPQTTQALRENLTWLGEQVGLGAG